MAVDGRLPLTEEVDGLRDDVAELAELVEFLCDAILKDISVTTPLRRSAARLGERASKLRRKRDGDDK